MRLRAAALCLVSLFPAPSALWAQDNTRLVADAVGAAHKQEWVQAFSYALQVPDGVVVDVVDWVRLRDGEGLWPEYVDFIARNPDWPGMWAIYKSAEPHMPDDLTPAQILSFFKEESPRTGRGALLYARALKSRGQTALARDTILEAWKTLSMTGDEQSAILSEWGALLAPAHQERLENLLWQGLLGEAEQMFSRVDDGSQRLAEARIGLRRGARGVDTLIDRVPSTLQGDGGLAYDRMRWRMDKGRWDSAAELMQEQSRSAQALGRPEFWASARRSLARDTMRDGKGKLAYDLASGHFLPSDHGSYADLEWLAGFIALRQLNDPARAITHFERFKKVVGSPISHGRAGYWLGRAYEAAGQYEQANAEYGYGAAYQTSFYGQLAAQRLNLPTDPSLLKDQQKAVWSGSAFEYDPRIRAAILLAKSGEMALAEWFVVKVAIDMTKREEYAAFAQMMLDHDLPYFALRLAKRAANDGYLLMDSYYPVTALTTFNSPVAPELQMAIARQESELNPRATSPVGALGLMQVMPSTAAKLASELGWVYDGDKMLDDWTYNATIATRYLAQRMEEYDNSFVKTAAAYNAGPSRVENWVGRFGDPAHMSADQVVDWVEFIPYRETRNYVMRVVEALHVYRQRGAANTRPLQIMSDLEAG